MIFITRPTSITIKGDSWERTCGGFKSPLMGLPVHCQSKKPQLLKENSRVTYIIALTAFIPNYRLYEIVVLFFQTVWVGVGGKKRNMSDIFPHQHQEILFFLLLFLICHFAIFEFFIYWFYFYAKYFFLRFV